MSSVIPMQPQSLMYVYYPLHLYYSEFICYDSHIYHRNLGLNTYAILRISFFEQRFIFWKNSLTLYLVVDGLILAELYSCCLQCECLTSEILLLHTRIFLNNTRMFQLYLSKSNKKVLILK